MRALGIQLSRSWIALRALQHQCQRVLLVDVPGRSGGETDRQFVVVTIVILLSDVRALETSAELIVQHIAVNVLADKQCLRLGCRWRREFFLA